MNALNRSILALAITLGLTACGEPAPTESGVATVASDSVTAVNDSANAMTSTEAGQCDRDCILGIAETYLAAIVAHDPDAAPLASDITFVENITRMAPGEGLWESAVSAPVEFAIYVPDEINQSAGFLGVMTAMAAPPAPQDYTAEQRLEWAETAEKSEQPVIVAFRLQLEDGQITEAEHLLAGIRPEFMSTLTTPRPGIFTTIPASQRLEHAKLIELGLSYYDALDDNDGTLTPFAPDCVRHENGMITAGGNAGAGPNGAGSGGVARDCEGQLTSNAMAYIDRIENRRVFAADTVTGLVMGLSHFRHPMDIGPYEVTNMDGTTEMREMSFAPFDLPAAHIYKIGADGMMHEIEAMGFQAPYNAPTGWE
jgi:hypothetical protein